MVTASFVKEVPWLSSPHPRKTDHFALQVRAALSLFKVPKTVLWVTTSLTKVKDLVSAVLQVSFVPTQVTRLTSL